MPSVQMCTYIHIELYCIASGCLRVRISSAGQFFPFTPFSAMVFFLAVVFEVWSADQEHPHHLRTWWCEFLTDCVNQTLCSPAVCILSVPWDGSDAGQGLEMHRVVRIPIKTGRSTCHITFQHPHSTRQYLWPPPSLVSKSAGKEKMLILMKCLGRPPTFLKWSLL